VNKDNQDINTSFLTQLIRLGGALFYLSLPPTLFKVAVGVTVGMSVLNLETYSKPATRLEISEMFLLYNKNYNINVLFISGAAIIPNLREEEEFIISIFSPTNQRLAKIFSSGYSFNFIHSYNS